MPRPENRGLRLGQIITREAIILPFPPFGAKDASVRIHAQGKIPATRCDLDLWRKTLPAPWMAALEATMFTGWIYDHLLPHAVAVKVAHLLMLRAIVAAKKKNDRIDAEKLCDCLLCDFLPECYMALTELRERRRTLRYRNLLVRQIVQLQNRITCLLMEAGLSYRQQKLHQAGHCKELLAINPDIGEILRPLLHLCLEPLVACGTRKVCWYGHSSEMHFWPSACSLSSDSPAASRRIKALASQFSNDAPGTLRVCVV